MKRQISKVNFGKKMKRYFQRIIYSDGANPLPADIMALVFLLNFFNSVAMNIVFAILPKMVKTFGASEFSTGYLAGFIGSSIFLARTLVSFFWGYFSDTKGKKATILICVIGLALSTLAFGFSTNFYWVLVTRFMQGSFMGLVVICKAILADVCDETNLSIGMSYLVTASSVGFIFGPSLGGFFAFPADVYPKLFSHDGLFGKFPVLLPMLTITIGFSVGVILIIAYLPNDAKKKVGECSHLIPHLNDVTLYSVDKSSKNHFSNCENYIDVSLGWNEIVKKDKSEIGKFQIVECVDEEEMSSDKMKKNISDKREESKLSQVLKKRSCLISFILYGLFSFVAVGSTECFSVFAATTIEYNGMGFSTSQIATVLLIASGFLMILQLTVLPRVV